MKLLLIFTLCLISGGGKAYRNVTGYSGGSVLVKCKYQPKLQSNPKYFCRVSRSGCTELIKTEDKDKWSNTGRFSVFDNSSGAEFWVLMTELTVDDSGRYQCGVEKGSNTTVNLEIKEDPLYEKSISVIGRIGEDVNISCKYPQSHRTEFKFLCKRENSDRCNSKAYVKQSGKWIDKGKFSVCDGEEQLTFTVTFNNLTVEDFGEYWCAAESDWKSDNGYKVYFQQINLTVSALSAPITVVCVILLLLLLLIGLLFFILTRRKRNKMHAPTLSPNQSTQVSSNSHRGPPAASDYEEIKDTRLISTSDSGASTVYSTVRPPTDPSHPSHTTYGNVQLPTRPSDFSHPLYAAVQNPSISSDQNIYSTAQLPKVLSDSSAVDTQHSGESAEGPMYAMLNFSKDAASRNDPVKVRLIKKAEESCEYATVSQVVGKC
ncbi:uncharacterized protein [Salminus brasiliensis]|uniref:uncharacterized protein n=1 Tax=Salminus brasiliensis TaxID=930266 RepID=UPI003B82DB5B